MSETTTLDADQSVAASIDPEARQIVLAPPGSGKTEVVAALLEHLVDAGLDSFDEVLAISFSRAAVGALERRVRAGSSTRATIRTLDSLASRILDEIDEEDWRTLSFDARISRALRLIESAPEISDLAPLRHVIVDEVQDLVGERARLVLAILSRISTTAGFTLLGDPHQAVYDFQLQDEHDLTSAGFLDAARAVGAVREVRLSHQYRSRSAETRAAASLLRDQEMGAQRVRAVRSFVGSLLMAGDVTELAGPIRRWTGSTAVLCRTNGQAMIVAERLRTAGIPATTRGPADALPIAGWIAETFSGLSATVVSKADALLWLAETAPIPAPFAWRLLKDVEREYRSPERLDLSKLARGLARGLGSADLLTGAATDVIVSTIHRAKGLEFDNVVLVNPSDLLPGTATDEDASVAYVAITRGRDRLLAARCVTPDFLRIDRRSGRWFVGGYKAWMTRGFEVRGTDSRTPDGVQLDGRAGEYVGREVVAGLDRLRSSMEFPIYSLTCDGVPLATTTEEFGRLLAGRLNGPSRTRKPWPTLTGLAVDSVETLVEGGVVLDTPSLRLGLRVSGLAMLNWGDERDR